MKLLFTISYYLPYISGLTLYPARLAEKLVRHGYKVKVLTSLHKQDLNINETIKGVEVHRVPYLFKISKGFFMPRYFWSVFKEVRENDIVIVNLPQFEGFIPAFFAKLFGKKLLCIYHCEISLPKNIFNNFIENLLHLSNFISLLLADRIVTLTKDYATSSRLLPKFARKLIFIPPLIQKPRSDKFYTLSLRKRLYKYDKSRYIIGVVGRLAAEKGIEYLIESIPYLINGLGKDFVIIFVGPKEPVGEKEYFTKLIPLINKYSKYLIFLGEISSPQLGSFYSILDVLTLPSINSTEAFGMVQAEAMLYGVPVVATDLPGVRVPIQKTGMGEIARMRDKRDLADKIIKVLLSRDKYVKDKKIIANIFNADKILRQYKWLFSSLNDVSVSK